MSAFKLKHTNMLKQKYSAADQQQKGERNR